MKKISNSENLWTTTDIISFVEKSLGIELDKWQKDFILAKGNTAVRAGRQSGKSFAESLKIALFALLNPKTNTLIIAAVDRQSVALFEKVKSHIQILAKVDIRKRPTLHEIVLKNGSKIIALPAGRTGYGLRGFTIHKLVIDEAHYVPQEVFDAIIPMLATTMGEGKIGTIEMMSTPKGNIGFFYDAFMTEGIKETFTTFHVKSEDCKRISKDFLKQQRIQMTKLQYMQEYEAEFLDALQQFLSKDLVESCLDECSKQVTEYNLLGVDLGGQGTDPNAFISTGIKGEKSYLKLCEEDEDTKAWNTIKKIIALNDEHDYKKIGVDDGGLGSPILQFMLRDSRLKRKCIGLNSSSKVIDKEGKKRLLLKNDMYWNLKVRMEQGLVKFPKIPELINSLTSIQVEVNPITQNEIFFGKNDHIASAYIRAEWLIKTKGLNPFIICF